MQEFLQNSRLKNPKRNLNARNSLWAIFIYTEPKSAYTAGFKFLAQITLPMICLWRIFSPKCIKKNLRRYIYEIRM